MKYLYLVLSMVVFIACGEIPSRSSQDAISMTETLNSKQIYWKNYKSNICFVGYVPIGQNDPDFRSIAPLQCTPEVEALIVNPPVNRIPSSKDCQN